MNEAPTFADKLRDHLAKAKAAAGNNWNSQAWSEAVNALYAVECAAAKKTRKPKGAKRDRNPLFDALALCTGTRNLDQMTRNAAKACAVALADIANVTPGLTVEEIQRRATLYRRRWPDPRNLSPSALAKHWGQFAAYEGEAKTQAAQNDVYQQPEDWHQHAITLYGLEVADRMKERGWNELGPDLRASILAERQRQRRDVA